jgi:hypothetical protein
MVIVIGLEFTSPAEGEVMAKLPSGPGPNTACAGDGVGEGVGDGVTKGDGDAVSVEVAVGKESSF